MFLELILECSYINIAVYFFSEMQLSAEVPEFVPRHQRENPDTGAVDADFPSDNTAVPATNVPTTNGLPRSDAEDANIVPLTDANKKTYVPLGQFNAASRASYTDNFYHPPSQPVKSLTEGSSELKVSVAEVVTPNLSSEDEECSSTALLAKQVTDSTVIEQNSPSTDMNSDSQGTSKHIDGECPNLSASIAPQMNGLVSPPDEIDLDLNDISDKENSSLETPSKVISNKQDMAAFNTSETPIEKETSNKQEMSNELLENKDISIKDDLAHSEEIETSRRNEDVVKLACNVSEAEKLAPDVNMDPEELVKMKYPDSKLNAECDEFVPSMDYNTYYMPYTANNGGGEGSPADSVFNAPSIPFYQPNVVSPQYPYFNGQVRFPPNMNRGGFTQNYRSRFDGNFCSNDIYMGDNYIYNGERNPIMMDPYYAGNNSFVNDGSNNQNAQGSSLMGPGPPGYRRGGNFRPAVRGRRGSGDGKPRGGRGGYASGRTTSHDSNDRAPSRRNDPAFQRNETAQDIPQASNIIKNALNWPGLNGKTENMNAVNTPPTEITTTASVGRKSPEKEPINTPDNHVSFSSIARKKNENKSETSNKNKTESIDNNRVIQSVKKSTERNDTKKERSTSSNKSNLPLKDPRLSPKESMPVEEKKVNEQKPIGSERSLAAVANVEQEPTETTTLSKSAKKKAKKKNGVAQGKAAAVEAQIPVFNYAGAISGNKKLEQKKCSNKENEPKDVKIEPKQVKVEPKPSELVEKDVQIKKPDNVIIESVVEKVNIKIVDTPVEVSAAIVSESFSSTKDVAEIKTEVVSESTVTQGEDALVDDDWVTVSKKPKVKKPIVKEPVYEKKSSGGRGRRIRDVDGRENFKRFRDNEKNGSQTFPNEKNVQRPREPQRNGSGYSSRLKNDARTNKTDSNPGKDSKFESDSIMKQGLEPSVQSKNELRPPNNAVKEKQVMSEPVNKTWGAPNKGETFASKLFGNKVNGIDPPKDGENKASKPAKNVQCSVMPINEDSSFVGITEPSRDAFSLVSKSEKKIVIQNDIKVPVRSSENLMTSKINKLCIQDDVNARVLSGNVESAIIDNKSAESNSNYVKNKGIKCSSTKEDVCPSSSNNIEHLGSDPAHLYNDTSVEKVFTDEEYQHILKNRSDKKLKKKVNKEHALKIEKMNSKKDSKIKVIKEFKKVSALQDGSNYSMHSGDYPELNLRKSDDSNSNNKSSDSHKYSNDMLAKKLLQFSKAPTRPSTTSLENPEVTNVWFRKSTHNSVFSNVSKVPDNVSKIGREESLHHKLATAPETRSTPINTNMNVHAVQSNPSKRENKTRPRCANPIQLDLAAFVKVIEILINDFISCIGFVLSLT